MNNLVVEDIIDTLSLIGEKMITSRKPKIKPTVYVMLIILLSSQTLLIGTTQKSVIFTTVGIVMIIVFSSIMIIYEEKRLKVNNFSYFIVVTVFIIIMMLFNLDINLNNIFEIVVFLTAAVVVNILSQKQFCTNYYNILRFIMIFSIVAYFLGMVCPPIIRLFPIINNANNIPFRWMLFSVLPENDLGQFSLRNYGPFREPGVFIIYIALAFIIGKKYKLIKKYDFVIMLIAIITTLSTSGYVIATLMILSLLLEKQNYKKVLITACGILIGIVLLYNFTNLLDPSGPVFVKFSGGESATARLGSVKQNFELMKNYPVIGAGWTAANIFFENSRYNIHNTNTLLFFFSYYGLIVGIVYFVGLYKFLRLKSKGIYSYWLLLIALIALCTERLTFDIVLSTFIYYGLIDREIKEDKNSIEGIMAKQQFTT